MSADPFQLSMETVLGAAPMLGHKLEDRSRIRDAQEPELVRACQAYSTVRLSDRRQRGHFCVAPLDILVAERNGRKEFHLLEINGTGIGGLTNISKPAVAAVLDGLAEMAGHLEGTAPLILVAVSGKESDAQPRLNKLLHEKLLYAEALKRGFENSERPASVLTLTQIVKEPDCLDNGRATIVLGYIKEFLDALHLESDGRLSLAGRPVDAVVNDRFCLNLLQQFGRGVDLEKLQCMNRGFLAGADKGVAYDLVNDYLLDHPHRFLPDQVNFQKAYSRQELIATVLRWLRAGRQAVIKPQGTGLGHGIEFFLDADESEAAIVQRIDRSLRQTEEYYRIEGGALPYTVCEFVDGCTIRRPEHALFGHKFELRIVVYRDGANLRAFPSIAKISGAAYDPSRPAHQSLINNITASAEAHHMAGVEFMLPLARRDTLELLGLTREHLQELCSVATGFMRFVLDELVREPGRFGLPAEKRSRLRSRELQLSVVG